MSKDRRDSSPVTEIEYAVTYTCSTPGCITPQGEQNYEIVTFIGSQNILDKMRCTACGSDMRKSNVTEAGGVHKEIWT